MQQDLDNSGKRTPNFALEAMAHIGFVLWNADNYNQCKIQIEETLHLVSRLDDTFLAALLKCIMSSLHLRSNNLEGGTINFLKEYFQNHSDLRGLMSSKIHTKSKDFFYKANERLY